MSFAGDWLLAVLLATASSVAVRASDGMVVPVDSPAFVFSPANWTGDADRSGHVFRQTWNPGAYFRVKWESAGDAPTAGLLLDTSDCPKEFDPPVLSYCIDGKWTLNVPCSAEVKIRNLEGPGIHELCVYLTSSVQKERWGEPGKSGRNVLRVRGLKLDDGSRPVNGAPSRKWVFIVGDSITEGSGASALSSYSHLVGQALRRVGFEYGISACGWSGWLARGDVPPGDVPAYYVVSGSTDGRNGVFHDRKSRWNKIDGNGHSLLDENGRISAYGGTGQEPDLILINYGTNDILHRSNPIDTRAAIVQGLAALRKSAPDAWIVVLVPFNQSCADELKKAVAFQRDNHPGDKIAIIDLGADARNALSVLKGAYGGLHPNDRGCANFAAGIIPELILILTGNDPCSFPGK